MNMIYESIFKPKEVVKYLNKRSRKFIYILLFLPLVLLIPFTMVMHFRPDQIWKNPDAYVTMLSQVPLNGYEISDGILHMPTESSLHLSDGSYQITFGSQTLNMTMYHIVFEKEALSFYIANMHVRSLTYQSLGMTDIEFSNPQVLKEVGTTIYQTIKTNSSFIIFEIASTALAYIIDFIIMVAFFALMSGLFMRFPLPFKVRFRLSTYLSVSYLLANLILIFLSMSSYYIPMLITYGYHLYVYRNLKLVKVETPLNE